MSSVLTNICNTPHKTPARTPKPARTPSADRFIPTRNAMDFDVCRLLVFFSCASPRSFFARHDFPPRVCS